jgi:Na+/melibiose symporter-like transporter
VPRVPSVWRERDFVRLWAATTISMLGSFITRTALPYAAILVLGAGAAEVAVMRSVEPIAALTLGLFAGAWVDRLRRRPILVWTDLGRAALLASIPLAFVLGGLTLAHLVVVAFGAAVLSTFNEAADRAFLPTVIGRDRLVEANATLTGSGAAAEFVGFGVSGLLIQLLSAPIAIALDAVSFVASALLVRGVRAPEPAPRPSATGRHVVAEIREGLAVTLGDPVLRPLALADAAVGGFWGVFGAVWLVFATELGFSPAVVGLVAAVGGLSSLVGAAFAGRAVRWLGVGRFFVGAMVVVTIGNLAIALTPGATIVGLACLLTQQILSDACLTAFDVVAVSIRQATVEDRMLGRVTASFRVLLMAAMLIGTVVGGVVAEAVGVRAAIVVAGAGGLIAVAVLWFSAVRRMRDLPEAIDREAAPAVYVGEDVPLTE